MLKFSDIPSFLYHENVSWCEAGQRNINDGKWYYYRLTRPLTNAQRMKITANIAGVKFIQAIACYAPEIKHHYILIPKPYDVAYRAAKRAEAAFNKCLLDATKALG